MSSTNRQIRRSLLQRRHFIVFGAGLATAALVLGAFATLGGSLGDPEARSLLLVVIPPLTTAFTGLKIGITLNLVRAVPIGATESQILEFRPFGRRLVGVPLGLAVSASAYGGLLAVDTVSLGGVLYWAIICGPLVPIWLSVWSSAAARATCSLRSAEPRD